MRERERKRAKKKDAKKEGISGKLRVTCLVYYRITYKRLKRVSRTSFVNSELEVGRNDSTDTVTPRYPFQIKKLKKK